MSHFIRTSHNQMQAVKWGLHRRFRELVASGTERTLHYSFYIQRYLG
jgi:hypothetical protein